MKKSPDYIEAHEHSIRHRRQLLKSNLCGCFYCLEIFPPTEINSWINDGATENQKTANCAKCGIDSVIGSASGYPITKQFLKQMHYHWFERIPSEEDNT